MGSLPNAPALSRRRLLTGSAALAAGAAGTSIVGAGAPLLAATRPDKERRRTRAGVFDAEWARLAKRLVHGRLLRPWDADFHLIALPNNLRYAEALPAGIARCGSARDVAAAVDWARQNNMPLVARGGGHSYAGFSAADGGLMIETTWINHAEYDPATKMARIGGGARNRDLYRLLRLHGRGNTHGRCPSVGAAGFLLGGGIGFNMRAQGLGCDQLKASEMVLADGVLHRLSADADKRDRDLFWAARGCGGGNLGISTSFTLETFDVKGQGMTVFDIRWIRTPENKGAWRHPMEAIGAELMEQMNQAPPALGGRISFGAVTARQLDQGYDVSISLLGQFAGPRSGLDAILAPVYALGKPTRETISELPYWDAQDFLHEEGFPTFYQERSAFVNRPFGPNDLAAGFAFLRQWPGTNNYCDLRFFQTGGRINDVKPGDTAFAHRDSRWLMVVGLYWSDGDNHDKGLLERNHDWQDRFYAHMRPLAGGGAYQNFTDPSLTDYRRAYYGQNLERLTAIKRVNDPDNLFDFPQAI